MNHSEKDREISYLLFIIIFAVVVCELSVYVRR